MSLIVNAKNRINLNNLTKTEIQKHNFKYFGVGMTKYIGLERGAKDARNLKSIKSWIQQ